MGLHWVSASARVSNPYREDQATLRERVFRLERENADLKGTLGSLFIIALLLGAAAGWWLGLSWR